MSPMNNVKVKLLFLTSLLVIILIISAPVVNSVFVNLINPTETVTTSSSASVFVDPVNILDETLQPYNTTTFHVNITDVEDLFTWQINMTWDTAVLNLSNIVAGEFLALSVNDTSSEALGGVVINVTNNVEGYAAMAESILANVSGIAGSGRLVSIEFTATGYGCCNLTIEADGTLSTMLLNSTGDSIAFTATDGYFSNKIPGDVNGNRIVDGADFSLMGGAYRATPGDPNWDERCDINRDGIVDGADFSIAGGNYRRSI